MIAKHDLNKFKVNLEEYIILYRILFINNKYIIFIWLIHENNIEIFVNVL